jgi:hypothetical protein
MMTGRGTAASMVAGVAGVLGDPCLGEPPTPAPPPPLLVMLACGEPPPTTGASSVVCVCVLRGEGVCVEHGSKAMIVARET